MTLYFRFSTKGLVLSSAMRDDVIKKKIVEASKSLFQKKGYHKVTMDDIAKAAGKGRSTLYYYFNNKHAVFNEVATSEYMMILSPAFKVVKEENTITENLMAYIQTKLGSIMNTVINYNQMILDIRDDIDFTIKVFKKVRNSEVELFKTMLTWGMNKKEIATITDEDVDFLSLALVTGTSSLEQELLLYGSINDMHSRSEWLVNLLIKGLQ